MKNIIKIILLIFLSLGIYNSNSYAKGVVEFGNEKASITKVSIDSSQYEKDLNESVPELGKSILSQVKAILGGVIIVYIVYLGVTMILAMGSDDEKLTSSKKQLRYSLMGFLLINIPGTLFNAFHRDNTGDIKIDGSMGTIGFTSDSVDGSILINPFSFGYTVNDSIIGFLKVFIGTIAVFVIVLAGIKIMTARGRDEQVTESKNKIIYSIMGLIFVGFIDVWKNTVFNGNVEDGRNMFEQLANLSLYFAGPVAIFFLSLAGYYYISAGGDEEKTKKAKNIIFNTLIATVLLLASYTFLLDLATL